MKGVVIQEGLEIKLEVYGDAFHQGDLLTCTVSIRNPGSTARDVSGMMLTYAAVSSKPKKDTDPLRVLFHHRLKESFSIAPAETVSAAVEIPLTTDSQISDSGSTLQFLYGFQEDPTQRPRLPITILPHRLLIQISEVFSSAFGFTEKQRRWKDGLVEIKFKPSSDKRFSLLDELLLSCAVTSEELILKYDFKIQSLQTTASSVKFQKGKKQFESMLPLRSLLLTPSQIDTGRIEPVIAEALETVRAGF